MSTYVLPQVLVYDDILTTQATALHPLPPLIVGGNAMLLRYAQEAEREMGRLGTYDPIVDSTFVWPNRPPGGVVDLSYVKVWVKNALLRYFSNPIDAGDTITTVSGHPNRVQAAVTNFATNGTYPRDSTLYDRDVQIGDTVQVNYVPSGGSVTSLWTYVQGLIGTVIAGVVGAASPDASNAPTGGASATVSFTNGPINCVTPIPSGGAYSGYAAGRITETYRVIVLSGSTGGDLSTARLRVISASGTDDVLSVTPAAVGFPTAIGTRGLTTTFTINHSGGCSASAVGEDVSPVDLLAGQEWQFVVSQSFTAPVATAAGTYNATENTTYVVQVVRGGLYSSLPQIKITTSSGSDLSGPTIVTGASTAVSIGSRGVTISFTGLGLVLGDRYYVPVSGVAQGPLQTLVLGHNLPSGVSPGDRVGVTLYIRQPTLQLAQNRTYQAPLTNWSATPTNLFVYAGAIAYDPTWTSGGAPLPLPLQSEASLDYGTIYVEYRAWLPNLIGSILELTDISQINLIPGVLDPDNPLMYAASKALANSGDVANGTTVKVLAVSDPTSLAAWTTSLRVASASDAIYGLVPLTRDPAVFDLFHAHATDMSTPENAMWRVCWFNLSGVPEIPIVSAGSTVPGYVTATTSDSGTCLCVFQDDPNTAGEQYTILLNPAGNGKFLTNGVAPGDVVRGLYTGDGFGNPVYTEFEVDIVQSENQLRLVVGPDAAQPVLSKVEIWRNLDPAGEAAAIAKVAGAYADPRVRAVWPDKLEDGAMEVDGFYLCAALAALTGGVLPQRPVTRVSVNGFTAAPRTTIRFHRDELNVMAVSGTWIVTQDPSGPLYTRQAVTTAAYNQIPLREESMGRNVDSVNYRFRDYFAPYIGVVNAVDSMLDAIKLDFMNLTDLLKVELFTPQLGGQIVDATLVRLSASAAATDQFVLVANVTFPSPLNNLVIHLVI